MYTYVYTTFIHKYLHISHVNWSGSTVASSKSQPLVNQRFTQRQIFLPSPTSLDE